MKRVFAAGIPLAGASDHGVSEAMYLKDPDGTNVETVYHGSVERSAASVVFSWDA